MTTKLTKSQVEVLRELAKAGVLANLARPETRADYWWLSTNYKSCTRQVNALIKAGYAKEEGGVINHRQKLYAKITNAGRAYLSQLDAAPEGVMQ